MKRFILQVLLVIVSNFTYSQVITKQEIEEYTNLGDMSWSSKAKELSNEYKLNDNGELSLSVVKIYKEQSKSQLYQKVLNWILAISSDAQSALLTSDKTTGQILARCYLPDIAKRTMGDNSYRVSIRPLLKFDFKEEKIRFTFALQCYDVLKKIDDSGYVLMSGYGFGITGGGTTKDNQVWALKECYPFAEGDEKYPKVTSARALVNTLSCYNILIDKINEVLQKPLSTENDDW